MILNKRTLDTLEVFFITWQLSSQLLKTSPLCSWTFIQTSSLGKYKKTDFTRVSTVSTRRHALASVRQRVREKVREATERKAQVEQEQNQLVQVGEQIVERLPLRERLKDLFKKHGFTVATVVTAVGITIGVLAKMLADGAGAAANGIKTIGKKVGDGLKELGKKIGAILPGLVGAIASFVFRAAGQAITFLGKNVWLLILFVAAFLIEKITKKRRE